MLALLPGTEATWPQLSLAALACLALLSRLLQAALRGGL